MYLCDLCCWTLGCFPSVTIQTMNNLVPESFCTLVWGYLLGRFLELELLNRKGFAVYILREITELTFLRKKVPRPRAMKESVFFPNPVQHRVLLLLWFLPSDGWDVFISFLFYFVFISPEKGQTPLQMSKSCFCFTLVNCLSSPLLAFISLVD